jgi:ribonuclease J
MSEGKLCSEMAKVMSNESKPVFIQSSSTNYPRLISIYRACEQSGRKIAADPFLRAIAEDVGLDFSSIGFMPRFMDKEKTPRAYQYFAMEREDYFKTETLAKMNRLTYLVRESMGDFLKRLNRYRPLAGSLMLYSMWKGYDESPRMKAFLDTCISLGIDISYLHTSGHAYRDTLEKTILRFSPDTLIPIHTYKPQAFSELFENVKLLDDGEEFTV